MTSLRCVHCGGNLLWSDDPEEADRHLACLACGRRAVPLVPLPYVRGDARALGERRKQAALLH